MAVKGYFLKDTRGTHLNRGLIIDDSSGVRVGFAYDNGRTVYLRFNQDDGHPLSEKFYERFGCSATELNISLQDFSGLIRRLDKAQIKLMHAITNFFESNPYIKPINEYPPEEEKRAKKIKKLERNINTQFDRFLQKYAPNLVGKI